jgi:hypothetical protein
MLGEVAKELGQGVVIIEGEDAAAGGRRLAPIAWSRYLGQGREQRRFFMTVAGFYAIDAIVVALMAFFAWGSHRRASS